MSTTNWNIREARASDVPAISVLLEEFAAYMRDLGDTTELRLDAAALERDGFGPEPAFESLVAEDSGVVIGFLLYHHGYDTDAAQRLLFVVDLFVTEHARGRGIAAALMGEARAIATRAGAAQLVWTVDRRNATARRFYENIGARYVEGLELMYLDVQPPARPTMAAETRATPDLGRAHLRVARPTADLEAVLRFYRDGLGLEVLDEFRGHDGFDGVMVGRRGAAYHLEFTRKAGHEAAGAPSEDDLLVFYLPDEGTWRAAVRRIEQAGYAAVKSFNPYWDEKGRTFEDPDGYRVVLQNAG